MIKPSALFLCFGVYLRVFIIESILYSEIKALYILVVVVERFKIKVVIEISKKFRDQPNTFAE